MVWEKERKILTAISSDASPIGSFETIITKWLPAMVIAHSL